MCELVSHGCGVGDTVELRIGRRHRIDTRRRHETVMTIRNLDALFRPGAITLVGASNRPNSVGAVLAQNLFEAGFRGPILTVNPHEQAIRSSLNYRSVSELPLAPDLAVIATPPAAVPGLIAELGARGCRAAVVVTAGFGEGERAEGKQLRQAMLSAAKPHLLRILGPNCLGFISPATGINASFAQLTPRAGDLAFVTQSGALATAVLDWAAARVRPKRSRRPPGRCFWR